MKVCIPTTDDNGLGGRLSEHFGRCPFFTLVDVGTGRVEILPNGRPDHESGECGGALGLLAHRSVQAVVCRGMGRRALDRLGGVGLPVLRTEAWSVAEAVREFRAGALSPLTGDRTGHAGDDHSGHSHGSDGHGCNGHGGQGPAGG
jgi:predicted Fe-Mo cluster-binding NifX family protein